jgi:hypothetical protein
MPIAEVVQRQMRTAENGGHGDEDMAATYWASAPEPPRGAGQGPAPTAAG